MGLKDKFTKENLKAGAKSLGKAMVEKTTEYGPRASQAAANRTLDLAKRIKNGKPDGLGGTALEMLVDMAQRVVDNPISKQRDVNQKGVKIIHNHVRNSRQGTFLTIMMPDDKSATALKKHCAGKNVSLEDFGQSGKSFTVDANDLATPSEDL